MGTSQRLTWLITGCSSGFGRELALEALDRGGRVIATARNGVERLFDLQRKGASTLELDIGWSQERISTAVQSAIETYGGIDVLVNNAGFVAMGITEEMPLEAMQHALDINTFGAVKVMRAVLPHFRARRQGTNVIMGSINGWSGFPCTSPYALSKWALAGIAETVRTETEPFGVETIMIEPGWFRTECMSETNLVLSSGPGIDEYDDARETAMDLLQGSHASQPGDPRKAAARIVDIVQREGRAKDRSQLPLRLPLGQDAVDLVREKCLEQLRVLDEWEDVLTGTDFDV